MKRPNMKILVVDHQTYWREYSAEILRRAGHQLLTVDSYKEALQQSEDTPTWDLILLGCASVTQQEHRLIAQLSARQQSVIVLSTTLSLQDLRSLFLEGALDVTDKTYLPTEIVTIVEHAQEQLIMRDRSWTLVGKGAFT